MASTHFCPNSLGLLSLWQRGTTKGFAFTRRHRKTRTAVWMSSAMKDGGNDPGVDQLSQFPHYKTIYITVVPVFGRVCYWACLHNTLGGLTRTIAIDSRYSPVLQNRGLGNGFTLHYRLNTLERGHTQRIVRTGHPTQPVNRLRKIKWWGLECGSVWEYLKYAMAPGFIPSAYVKRRQRNKKWVTYRESRSSCGALK